VADVDDPALLQPVKTPPQGEVIDPTTKIRHSGVRGAQRLSDARNLLDDPSHVRQ
jgi:hypothetical protein